MPSRVLCLIFAIVPFLLFSLHQANAQAAELKLTIPDYNMKNGASMTQSMTISVQNAQNVTITSLDFAYHREWLTVRKQPPFDISYDPVLKCVCTNVPITVTLPQDAEGGRDVPVTVKGTAGAEQLIGSSSLRVFAEGSSVNQWTVIFVSVVVPIAATVIGVIFVYKRVISK